MDKPHPESSRQFLQTWWHHLPLSERVFLFFVGLVASVAIPLSVNTVKHPVSVLPQAYSPINVSNRLPSISSQNLHCRVNQACTVSVQATAPHPDDTLKLTVDFLPPGLSLGPCQTQPRLSCPITGTSTRAGHFRLQAKISDSVGNHTSQIISLTLD